MNPNSEIVLARKVNDVELCFLKICKNCIQKWILQVIFSRRCLDCPKNKVVNNFLITNPNEMDQRIPCRQKYNLQEKNILEK